MNLKEVVCGRARQEMALLCELVAVGTFMVVIKGLCFLNTFPVMLGLPTNLASNRSPNCTQ